MAVTFEWRGQFSNSETNALHAEAFGTRLFDEAEWNWEQQVVTHSLGWVVARDIGQPARLLERHLGRCRPRVDSRRHGRRVSAPHERWYSTRSRGDCSNARGGLRVVACRFRRSSSALLLRRLRLHTDYCWVDRSPAERLIDGGITTSVRMTHRNPIVFLPTAARDEANSPATLQAQVASGTGEFGGDLGVIDLAKAHIARGLGSNSELARRAPTTSEPTSGWSAVCTFSRVAHRSRGEHLQIPAGGEGSSGRSDRAEESPMAVIDGFDLRWNALDLLRVLSDERRRRLRCRRDTTPRR